jgi:hypothetical protein
LQPPQIHFKAADCYACFNLQLPRMLNVILTLYPHQKSLWTLTPNNRRMGQCCVRDKTQVDFLLSVLAYQTFVGCHKLFFFCGTGAWTQGLHLDTPPVLFCEEFFQHRVSQNYLPWMASNLDHPDLCLLSS